jgi:hypothetical protein
MGNLDFESLRLSQDFERGGGAEKVLTTIPVRKPGKTEFVRVHPEHHFETLLLDLKEEHESYLILPVLRNDVASIAHPVSLRLAISRLRVLFVWPLRLPGADGRLNSWHQSAWEGAELAKQRWIRMAANMPLGAYDIFRGQENLSEPEWPDKPFEEILNVAFRGRVIEAHDHPVLKRLRGEI